MKVLHVSPTFFGDSSFIGGGERYVLELARAMSRHAETCLLSFAPAAATRRDGDLRIEYIRKNPLLKNHPLNANPFSLRFARCVRWADVVHCHQVHTHATDFATLWGKFFGKKIFVTDLGGGHPYALSSYLPLLRRVNAFLLISDYSRKLWQETAQPHPHRLEVIYGGVDSARFTPSANGKSRRALFVGRLLPHKGIDYLMDAIEGDLALDIVGRKYHEEYFQLLQEKSRGKSVQFHTNQSDSDLVQKYQQALVTILPSVYDTCYGDHTAVPELFGLVAIESLACGTPVILSDVASLPEIVEDGVTGFLVPPNNPAAIREKLEYLHAHPEIAARMGLRGREIVLQRYTWDAVAKRCLEAYGNG